MIFPIALQQDLSTEHQERWQRYYLQPSDRDRRREDGIWRRTQEEWNASESGWRGCSDQRRRIVHYTHQYNVRVAEGQLQLELSKAYLYYSLSLPEEEITADLDRVRNALERGGWSARSLSDHTQVWEMDDLICALAFVRRHTEDALAARVLPYDYRTLDVTIRTKGHDGIPERLPWEVLAKGMRMKEVRENPSLAPDLSALVELSPFHVELGCGISIEAGVPALHHLHDLYRVTEMSTGRFVFGGPSDDLVERLLLRPVEEFAKLGELYKAAFLAEPTPAHHALINLRNAGHLVGRIMTNNFDGLAHRVGLNEHFLRRYDETIPDVEFSAQAKSLLVVGSHADRRRVQARARERGLKVVYLDPEGYRIGDQFLSYPLEGPRDGDVLCRKGASEGLTHLCSLLGVQHANAATLIAPSSLTFREVQSDGGLAPKLEHWWKDWATARPDLFNGPVLACHAIDIRPDGGAEIAWYATTYAHYLQRRASPPIAQPARALFCSVALLSRSGSLVIGQMSTNTSAPLLLQLPGGNIDLGADRVLSPAHCASEAARELIEEIGVSIEADDLRLWRIKTGGAYNDVGLIYVYRSEFDDEAIQNSFARHQESLKAQGKSPEFERLVLIRPASFSQRVGIECVDYLSEVTAALAREMAQTQKEAAVLFHTHGIGRFDFSTLAPSELSTLNELAATRNLWLCPTVYLTEARIADFDILLRTFAERKKHGELERILGWAVEGPVLGPKGGTPTGSTWRPTESQWRRIAEWFPLGLQYVVMAPDMVALEDEIDLGLTFGELVTLIYSAGGRLALGHFEGTCELTSAERLENVLAHIERDYESSPYLVLTDHLFNDMPRAFKHAFRTNTERATRDAELAKHAKYEWRSSSLANLLGPVPAALLIAAREKRLTPCLNFDGGHVDLGICKLVVDFLGPDRIIAITDHTEISTLAGEPLSRDDQTHLLYRADGVLAASAVTHEGQHTNMRSIGMTNTDIDFVQRRTPLAALSYKPCRKHTLSTQA